MAISKYDQFDFLIDIVPRDEIKPKKETETTKTSTTTSSEPISYFSQISGGGEQGLTATIGQPIQAIQATNQLLGTPMLIPIQTAQGEVKFSALPTQLGQLGIMGQQQMPQQIILQQVMSPNGEITQIPVSKLICLVKNLLFNTKFTF